MNLNLPQVISLGREVCGDLAQAERREWWLANGLGGYAAGTIAGTLTRRYHGLLVAPVNPPLGRCLVLAKADATLIDGEHELPLFANRWRGGAVAPQGHLHIESFRLEGRMPVWRYAIGDVLLEQRIWMEQGANTTYVAFRLVPGAQRDTRPLQLRLTLLVNARDHHSASQAGNFDPSIEHLTEELRVTHADWFTLYLKARGGEFTPRKAWYRDFDLPLERERQLPDSDNHLCVGDLTLQLNSEECDEWVGLAASLDEHASAYLGEAMRRFSAGEIDRLRRAVVQVPELIDAPDWIHQLTLAASSFIFARPLDSVPDGESVIAGYPWFGDWGRDTMIALPGLTLATGRQDTALRILRTYARFVDRGMLPNVFPGAGATAEYNTVDAALWYVEAWRAYVETTHDRNALREVMPVLAEIIDWHVRGTRYGIQVDPADGLLRAGEAGVQITWMDAKIGDWVVTPRIGKPVEINALWFNALCTMAGFAELLKLPSADYKAQAARVRESFRRFVNPANGGLFDVLDGPEGDDATVRPNQIFAVSLPHSPLDLPAQQDVLRLVGRELLTSYGLRSLDSRHPDYRPHYVGGVVERDSGYHQGPVWAWLLGHYALAEYRVSGDAEAAQMRLSPLRDHLLDAGLGTVSEIFDGAPPHTPRGAPSQAWSVACTLETWWRLERAKREVGRIERSAVANKAA